MRYFSYNDYMDCTENGEIKELEKVEEKIARYELKNGPKTQYCKENRKQKAHRIGTSSYLVRLNRSPFLPPFGYSTFIIRYPTPMCV